MNLRSVCLLACVLLAFEPVSMKAGPKPIMVHYMPWFVAEPFSSSWGWHWTMNHFNPNATNSLGEREIASWYYPMIGPYDSDDPAVLQYQVLLMKLAGVDGVIVDWYGMDNYLDYGVNNQRTAALFQFTRRAGLKFCLCYEDHTITVETETNGLIYASNAISHAQQTMLYAETNYFNDPSYLRWNNQPVLLDFGPQYFTSNSDWVSIFSVLTNPPAFFTEDNRFPVGAGAFDWPPMYLSGTNGILSTNSLNTYLANFQQKGAAWPAFISSAFPRFHDIYAQAGVSPSLGYLDDANGTTFQNTLSLALTNNSAIAQIVTWNDFGEGTIVEPTVDYGFRDLGVIQDYRRQYVDPSFPCQTNDLNLASQFYNLRRQYASNPLASAELDRVFTNIVSNNLAAARLQLQGLQRNLPVIYNLSLIGGSLQFSVGGFIYSNGAQVQTSSNLLSGWQSVTSYPGSTNQMNFTAPVSNVGPAFFKVQSTPP